MALKEADVVTMEQKKTIIVGLDKTWEQILALDKEKDVEIVFDTSNFKELEPDQVKWLSMATLKAYWIAEAKAAEIKERGLKVVIIENPLGNSSDAHSFRLKTRERRGWHTYWAKPGADFERCMASGSYKQIRKQKEGAEKQEAGYEEGDVLKILDSEGKVELVALKCREEDYQQYLQWMDQQSSLKYGAVKNEFAEKTDALNRGLSRGSRIIPGETDQDGNFKSF